MISKVEDRHLHRAAYVYVRQSTLGQVRFHQESTERQYGLREKALEMGWDPNRIRILDGDLGLSGSQASGRNDFQSLMTDVSKGQVGVVIALEASRLARSSLDWHRLIQLCAWTDTLVIDEDGCYRPGDFNDGLLLGLKGTLAEAELHFLHARLQGGKVNKARRGELRFPLPVGFVYDPDKRIVPDPDVEVQGRVRLVFSLFRQTGSAYAVVQHFTREGLTFPKRAYGGAWDGRLIWGRLGHGRVLGLLKNPCYAGVYVFGRYRVEKGLGPDGEICCRTRAVDPDSWLVKIPGHHEGYICWEDYLENRKLLETNRTNAEETRLSGAAREGLALLQGLVFCARCGRRLTPRYQGNAGLYPIYECSWRRREGLHTGSCLMIRCELVDAPVCRRVLEVLEPAQLEIALRAVEEVERREHALLKQWEMRLQRADYEAQLAERRYAEVDPSNRLVAATLERRWNEALEQREEVRRQWEEFQARQGRAVTAEQKAEVLRLAQDFPRLWKAPTTSPKDRKRMLRLLIRDITVETVESSRQLILHLRWQGGACEDLRVERPLPVAERLRYSPTVIERVRELGADHNDSDIARLLRQEGYRSAKGKELVSSMVAWIRYRYGIPRYEAKRDQELTVRELAVRFGVSLHAVYYWIERGVVPVRRGSTRSRYCIRLTPELEAKLEEWIDCSKRLQTQRSPKSPAGGAL